MNKKIDIKDLFAVGFQYGHKVIKTSPKMKEYVYSVQNGVSMIDLPKTVVMFNQALEFLHNTVQKGGIVWFVGTKYRIKDLVKIYAKDCEQYYINKRWLGGTITNYGCTILNQLDQLSKIEKEEELGIIAKLAKKEQMQISRKKNRILDFIEGVRNSPKLPDLLIIIDAKKEFIALQEAKRSGIPTLVLMDTDTKDPGLADYVVPGNDDGCSSVEYFLKACSDVIKDAMASSDVYKKLKTVKNNKLENDGEKA